MPTVALKALTLPPTPDGYYYFDQIVFTSGSPPDRPQPEPPLGIWGPTDPRPGHPISGIPGLPGYEPPAGSPPGIWGGGNVPMPNPPIANVPGAPGYTPPQPGEPPRVVQAVVMAVPEGVTAPDAPPADATVGLISFGPGTKPTWVWAAPYVSTGPV